MYLSNLLSFQYLNFIRMTSHIQIFATLLLREFNLLNVIFCQVKNASICVLPLLSDQLLYLKCFLLLRNSQGVYPINSYINWLLSFTWTNTSMKNVSIKVNLITLKFSYLGKLLKIRMFSNVYFWSIAYRTYFFFFLEFSSPMSITYLVC